MEASIENDNPGFSLLSSLIKLKRSQWEFLGGEEKKKQGSVTSLLCVGQLIIFLPNEW